MTAASETFRKTPHAGYPISSGPTKFLLMLAIFDGEQATISPRLYSMEVDFGRGSRSIQVHILGATWNRLDTWIIEGIEGYIGMSGLVHRHTFIAEYCTANKKGKLKYLS